VSTGADPAGIGAVMRAACREAGHLIVDQGFDGGPALDHDDTAATR
jgi:hypothetical protein